MPKISVHLEADSAEEFRQLLAAFNVSPWGNKTREWVEPGVGTPEKDSTRTVEKTPEPATVRVPETIVETQQEPAQPRRGRPRKEKPAEPSAGTAAGVDVPDAGTLPGSVEAAPQVTPRPVSPVEEPIPAVVQAAPAPKVKTMPHAKPENGAATRQDLLDAFSEYVQRYGASFGFSDISSLLQKNLGDGVRKASDVPEDKLPVAIGAIKTAIADNPFNRKRDYA